ncbi:hypothetical protein IL306_004880 [Fusarium sp. DS 682]|nr:hypothetical protein IL306_004880 [Fusarium sp. DS 682]
MCHITYRDLKCQDCNAVRATGERSFKKCRRVFNQTGRKRSNEWESSSSTSTASLEWKCLGQTSNTSYSTFTCKECRDEQSEFFEADPVAYKADDLTPVVPLKGGPPPRTCHMPCRRAGYVVYQDLKQFKKEQHPEHMGQEGEGALEGLDHVNWTKKDEYKPKDDVARVKNKGRMTKFERQEKAYQEW